MRFRLLGPLSIEEDGRPVRLYGNRPRAVHIHRRLARILRKLKGKADDHLFSQGTNRTWQRHLAPIKRAVPRFSMHALRHSFASHLVQRSVPLAEIQRLLGHASITTTQIYAHLAPGTGKAAVERL